MKRKYSLALLVVTLLMTPFIFKAVAYQMGKTMSSTEAESRWGKSIFDAAKFKEAKPSDRAKMVSDLIEKKQYVGKALDFVFQSLGRSDGHFFSDTIPAYLLNEGWKNKTDTWQVVFLPDAKTEKVKDVIIHRNCCD